MIEFEGSHPSPYMKELMNNPQIEFYDFTLEGPQVMHLAILVIRLRRVLDAIFG
jgi:hypothetical protein